jgi:protein gp37
MHENALQKPLEWKKPQVIFVNSMSDLFHKDVPFEFIERVFDVMKRAHWHQFQVLTKRAERVAELSPYLEWADNIWMGVSVETEKYKYRIDHLRHRSQVKHINNLSRLIFPIFRVHCAP